MGKDRARLLLHPVRMRVVVTLGARELTTREIAEYIPDVPQASLYRAIAQLHEADVLEITRETRRGGALERTYRVVQDAAIMTPEEMTSGTAEELLATVQTFADLIVSTAVRHVSSAGEAWRQDRIGLRQEALWVTSEQREEFTADMEELLRRYATRERTDGAAPWTLMMAMLPDRDPDGPAERLPPDDGLDPLD